MWSAYGDYLSMEDCAHGFGMIQEEVHERQLQLSHQTVVWIKCYLPEVLL